MAGTQEPTLRELAPSVVFLAIALGLGAADRGSSVAALLLAAGVAAVVAGSLSAFSGLAVAQSLAGRAPPAFRPSLVAAIAVGAALSFWRAPETAVAVFAPLTLGLAGLLGGLLVADFAASFVGGGRARAVGATVAAVSLIAGSAAMATKTSGVPALAVGLLIVAFVSHLVGAPTAGRSRTFAAAVAGPAFRALALTILLTFTLAAEPGFDAVAAAGALTIGIATGCGLVVARAAISVRGWPWLHRAGIALLLVALAAAQLPPAPAVTTTLTTLAVFAVGAFVAHATLSGRAVREWLAPRARATRWAAGSALGVLGVLAAWKGALHVTLLVVFLQGILTALFWHQLARASTVSRLGAVWRLYPTWMMLAILTILSFTAFGFTAMVFAPDEAIPSDHIFNILPFAIVGSWVGLAVVALLGLAALAGIGRERLRWRTQYAMVLLVTFITYTAVLIYDAGGLARAREEGLPPFVLLLVAVQVGERMVDLAGTLAERGWSPAVVWSLLLAAASAAAAYALPLGAAGDLSRLELAFGPGFVVGILAIPLASAVLRRRATRAATPEPA